MEETRKPTSGPISLGEVIAERVFSLVGADGAEVQITVRFGRPFKEESLGDYRCPLQVLGLGNDRIYAPWGEGPFVALQYAIDLIGELLDTGVTRKQLRFRTNRKIPVENRWIWR